INASKALAKIEVEGDEAVGIRILARALEAPMRQLAQNAGFEGGIVVGKVREQKKGVGFDVIKEEYRDMFEAGIIDPTKVTRSALQNAVSIAGMLLTTDALVAEIKEKEENPMPQMPGGMPPY
ncbi:MAG: TCP-1/cpn60 chaperonin family protein, partial [Thermotogota bacterium]